MVEIFSDRRSHCMTECSKKLSTHEIVLQTCPSTSIVFISIKFGAELLEPVVSVDAFSSEDDQLFPVVSIQESLSGSITVLNRSFQQ